MAGNGIFISFEGSEGCGKSTQIRRLAEALRKSGHEVISLREPGGTPLGEAIRDLLKHDPRGDGMAPETELLLFAASRAQLVREIIRPALERGVIVLCDRFLDSTTVYQGVARALDPSYVDLLNSFAVGSYGESCGTLPDLTLLLDLDAAEGRRRAALRLGVLDRMEQEEAEFYEAVRAGYLQVAAAHPERFEIIDANGHEEIVEAAIRKIFTEHFHGLF